jgi:hypothetical protein
MRRPTGCRCWTSWRTAHWEGRTHRTTDPWPPQRSVKDVAFGIEMGEVVDVEWRLGLADVNDHDLTLWIATADHDPAGVQEPVDAFGGETVDALTDGHRAGDRVEETDDPGLGLHFDGLPPAGSPGEARHEAGAEQ